ncbi:hypothetical protein K503DRAFT_805729 [Rhizopogon vinicolor AM-OR11-026]|uniref:Uncharacterized protein n=1 Tax=Rhizopogon vinicolor AM-OR11-026 TaxID=1314800 RepID=A0A1B7MGW0_9AGAM|nr:hypothetical protein K503DRAFT_805729 [Rhizopogon vinicolor AM-OR11-026]
MLGAANIRLRAFDTAPPNILFCVSLPADLSSLLLQSLALFVPQLFLQAWDLALELIPEAIHVAILQGSDAQPRLCFRCEILLWRASISDFSVASAFATHDAWT